MNQESEALLNQGISAVRGGNKREGARVLAQVVRAEPQSDDAWFWLAAATDQPNEAKACLDRVLKINPNHARARQALDLINQSGGGILPPGAFTGESVVSSPPAYNAPPPMPPSGNRPLNTGELLSPPGGSFNSPYGAPVAPPPLPYGGTNNFPPPPPFGATETNVPPPFGAPAWAQDQNLRSGDPYASATGSLPPPPFGGNTGGRGMSFGQLDPAAAAAQANQAVLDEQAGPKIYDPGSEIRRSLLGDPPAPPPGAMRSPVDPNAPSNPATPKPAKLARKNNRRLLLILVAAAVLMTAVVAFLALNRQATTTVATDVTTATPAASDLTAAAASVSPGAATTPAGATTQANVNATTIAVVATTVAGATTNAASGSTTTAATTISTQVATPTRAAGLPTPAPALTILPPRSPSVISGSRPSPEVTAYVNQANNLINEMAFVESQINTILVQPYKDGKFARGAVISKSYELSYFTLLMGQLSAQFRQLNPPAEANQLHQVGLDYANDIREAGANIDRFFDTGRVTFMDDTINLLSKASADRTKWFQTIQAGYPFKVNF